MRPCRIHWGLALAVSFLSLECAATARQDNLRHRELTELPAVTLPCATLPQGREPHVGLTEGGYQTVPFVCGSDPCEHGTNQAVEIDLGFDVYVFGQTTRSVWIHSDGMLFFNAFTSFIAACNADVDTGGPDDHHLGHVWYAVHTGRDSRDRIYHVLTVVWDHVAPLGGDGSLTNTFAITVSDRTIFKGGNSICLCYGDMEWAPKAVGSLGYNGQEYSGAFLGRFTEPGRRFEGPEGDENGYQFLTDRSVCFDTQNGYVPPYAVNFPYPRDYPDNTIHYVHKCEEVVFLFWIYSAIGLSSTIQVMGNVPDGMVISTTNGNFAQVYIHWEVPNEVGTFELYFNATDNRLPENSTTIFPMTFQLDERCTPLPETDPPTVSPTPSPTPSPTEVPCDRVDDNSYEFYVRYLDENHNCEWLADRPDHIELLCYPEHLAYQLCRRTCGDCTDPQQGLLVNGGSGGGEDDGACNDETFGRFFDVMGQLRKNCAWLQPRVDRLVSQSAEFWGPEIDVIANMTWGEVLCVETELAYHLCEETCGKCTDNCEDGDFFVTYYEVNGVMGFEQQTCVWLASSERRINQHCTNDMSTAAAVCLESCQTCPEE